MAITDFNIYKPIEVTSATDTPTISRALCFKITGGDESTTGTGEIVLDWSNISSQADIGVYDENGNLLDYYFESFDATNETAVIWVYRDWVRDGTVQAKIAYGNGPSDQSLVGKDVTNPKDGGWHFCSYSRIFNANNKTFLGWINLDGDIVAYSLNHDTKEEIQTILHSGFLTSGTEHANPVFAVLPDGKIIVFYCRGSDIHYRITTNPYDFSSWQTEQTISTTADYPNPEVMSDADDSIYLYFRDSSGTNRVVSYAKSTDGGSSWSAITNVVTGDDWLYPKTRKFGNKLHILVTRNVKKINNNSIYYFYYDNDNGTYHKVDGTQIATETDLPLSLTDLSLIYDDSSASPARAEDIRIDSNGNPVVTYVVYEGGDYKDHRYKYAYWEGSSWVEKEVTSSIPLNEDSGITNDYLYWGGLAIDPENLNALYLSQDVNGVFEIQKAETLDGGDTWNFTDITSESSEDQFRPRPVESPHPDFKLIWMSGFLHDHDDWDAIVTSDYSGASKIFDKESALRSGYLFNESSGDLIDIVSRNPGTVNGATQGLIGVVGGAYDFDGTDDNAILDDPFDFTSGPFALEVWVKRNSTGVRHCLLSNRNSEHDSGYELRIDSDDKLNLAILNKNNLSSSHIISDDGEYHLIGVVFYGDGTGDILLDGVLESSSCASSINSTNQNMVVASNSPNDDYNLPGSICHVRIHDDVVTELEHQAFYAATKSSPDFFSQQAVGTEPPTNITSTSATLNGTLENLIGNSSLDVYFEYGTDTSYGNTTATQTINSVPTSFSVDISGFTKITEYHCQAVATDGTNYWYGGDVSFYTADLRDVDETQGEFQNGTLTDVEADNGDFLRLARMDVYEDFEDGTLGEFTANETNFQVYSSLSYSGSYCAGLESSSGPSQPLATATPFPGGEQVDKFITYWQETSDANGHGVMLQDSNGNDVIGVASGNPEIEIDDGNGFVREGFFSDEYNVWIKIEVTFDWVNGQCDVYAEDTSTGNYTTFSDRPLKNNTDISKIELRDNSHVDWSSSGAFYAWFDRFEFRGGYFVDSGNRTVQLDLSSLSAYSDSLIEWTATVPTDTSLTIETRYSLDGGSSWSSWQTCTSGSAIPGLSSGDDLSNALLECRETLSTSDIATTPQLERLAIYLVESSGASLTFDSIVQGQIVVSPTLAQLQSLGISSVAQSQTVDSPSISQIQAITTDAIKQGQTIDSLSLQQMISLSIDAINQGQSVDSLTISQLVSLVVENIKQSQKVNTLTLEQLIQLTFNSVKQGQNVDTPTIALVGQLVIDSIQQGQKVSSVTISQLQQLAVDSVKQSQSIDSLTVDQLISLTINNISQDQLVNSPTLTLPRELVINSIIQGQNVVSPTLQQAQGLLDVASVSQGQSVSALSLEQVHSLITDSINQGQSIDTTNLDQLISLAIDSVSQGQALSEPSFYSITVLDIDSIQQGQTVEATSVSQVSQLIIDEISQGQVIENINFSIAKGRLQITITGKKPGVSFDGKAPTTKFQ